MKTRNTQAAVICALVALCGAFTTSLHAQVTLLTSFVPPNGQQPNGGLTLSADGRTLYGTTIFGGANNDGVVFSLPVGGGTPTILASFNGTNGRSPYAGLTLSAGGTTLYGTTYYGGANNNGEVFSLPVGGGTPNVLASFNGTNGQNPYAGLTLIGSTLYGTTYSGGANGDGTVFSVPAAGGGIPPVTVLASFNLTNGAEPYAGVKLSRDGSTLYGVTSQGGTNHEGTVFSVPVAGGSPTVLANLNSLDGAEAGLTLSADGSTLYGTTYYGGANNDGAVFSVPVTGGTPTVLASFNFSNGENPHGDLTLSADGSTLYGTTATGGTSGNGTVFGVSVAGGTPTVISFDGTKGGDPYAGLTSSVDGSTLYGTNSSGGSNGAGTVFSMPVPTPEPGTAGLLVVGSFLATMRRRR